jgi:DNA-binding GntR family transcriptional regulator
VPRSPRPAAAGRWRAPVPPRPSNATVATFGGLRYPAVAEWLRQRILAGEFTAGGQLPAQRGLAAEAGVTLMTFRRAVELLVDEGWLETRHGVGTFVALRPGARAPGLRSFEQVMRDQGRATVTRILSYGAAPAPPALATTLAVAAGSRYWYVERLRVVDGAPYTWQRSSQAVVAIDRRAAVALRRQSLYELLEEQGFAVGAGRQSVRAIALAHDIADHLGVPAGSPCLEVERLSNDAKGRPILHDMINARGDVALLRADAATSTFDLIVDHGMALQSVES